MPRAIWKGHISFGLVHIPITLYPAEKRSELHFSLVDSENAARVRYQRVNDVTGEEVPWDRIVKGWDSGGGNYVFFSEEELESASVTLTKTVEIREFVDLDDISVLHFDKPYYLVPGKGGDKGYVLLRQALRESGRVGIATVVVRTRQYLAAMLPVGNLLVLELLRFKDEIRDTDDLEVPDEDLEKHRVDRREVDLALTLIDGMTAEWQPEKYHDEYREAVMEMIERKIESGETQVIGAAEEEERGADRETRPINILDLLEKSVKQSGKGAKSSKKKSGTESRAKKKAKPETRSPGRGKRAG